MMRLKVLSLFVTIQVLSFGIWSSMSHAKPVTPLKQAHTQVHQVPIKPSLPTPIESSDPIAEDVTELEYLLHFTTRNMSEEEGFFNSIKINQIETALKKLPIEHVKSVRNLILDYDPGVSRGLGGNYLIILRGVNMSTAETVGVLIHEMGHNVDYDYLAPTDEEKPSVFKDWNVALYESDPSLDFYRISWLSSAKRKNAATNMDFVSGYAMADPFEDFAESYIYYILHNKDFKKLATSSKALYAKYRFMKYQVFDGMEFDTGDGIVKENQRPWDTTVLNYDIDQFLS